MARPTTTSKTKKVQVQQTGQTQRLEVNTPISTAGAGRGNAQTLANLFTIGGVAAKAHEDKQAEKGAVDFQKGTVDEENKSSAYRRSVNRLTARSNWIEDEKEIQESLRDLDLDNISQEELDAHLDEQFASRYPMDLDSETIGVVVPQMQQLRENIYQSVLDQQVKTEIEQNGAKIMHIAEDAYADTDFVAGETFDYVGLHEQIGEVYQGGDRNEAMFKTISDIAIRNGDVNLLTNLPDSWEDGQKSFKHIPKFNERMRGAEAAALAARTRITAAEEERQEAEQEAALNTVLMEAAKAGNAGDYGTAQSLMMVYAELPGAEADKMMTFLKGSNTLVNNRDTRAIDHHALSRLSSRVFRGESSHKEILDAFDRGVMGSGKQADSELQELLQKHITISDKKDPVWSSKPYAIWLKNLEDLYKPDRLENTFDDTMNTVRISARGMYIQEIENGSTPEEAFQKTTEKWDKIAALGPLSGENDIKGNEAYKDPVFAIRRFIADGGGAPISSTQLIQNGITAQTIFELRTTKQITEAEAEKAITRLESLGY